MLISMRIKKLDPRAVLPAYATDGSAGADLYLLADGPLTVEPHRTVLGHTGIALEIPAGYVGLIFARSGLSTRRDVAPANKVGVIDSDYRGEIMVPLHNHGEIPQTLLPGERIAQISFVEYGRAVFEETDCLDGSERGEGGFGSTGAG